MSFPFYSLSAPFIQRLALASVLLPGLAAQAQQAPTWQTALTLGPAGSTLTVTTSATDASGNVYLGGQFTGSLTLGATTLTATGNTDLFVAKWNPATASFAWALRAGSAGRDVAGHLAISGSSVYLSSTSDGNSAGAPVTFGTLTLGANPSTSGSPPYDVFVAKLLDAGSSAQFAWVKQGSGVFQIKAPGLAVNGQNVYLAGAFSGTTLTFDNVVVSRPSTAMFTNLSNTFLAKFTDAGATASAVWAQASGGTFDDQAGGLAVNGANVYVAGNFATTTSFGSLAVSPNATGGRTFVVKYLDAGQTGSATWATVLGGDYGYASAGFGPASQLVVSGANLFVTGVFNHATEQFGTATLTSAGDNDVFVAKLVDAGSSSAFSWAQRAGGAGREAASALAVSGASVYVGGSFASVSADFGATTLANAAGSASPATTDAFVARLNDAGASSSYVWAQRAGGPADDGVAALALTGSRLYAAGPAGTGAAFGGTTLAGAGSYLASLTDNVTLAATQPLLAAGLHLYPNPAIDRLEISSPTGRQLTAVQLLDGQGRPVAAPRRADGSVDLRTLAAGLYLVVATDDQQQYYQKLVKE